MKTTGEAVTYWWLACNGPSCAASPLPIHPDDLEVRPTPEQLLGFTTQEEQKKVQAFLLTAPPDQLQRYARGEKIPSVSFPAAYVPIPESLVEPPEQTTIWAVKGGAA